MSSYTIAGFVSGLRGSRVISWCRIMWLCCIRGQPSRENLIVNCGEFILTKLSLSGQQQDYIERTLVVNFFYKKNFFRGEGESESAILCLTAERAGKNIWDSLFDQWVVLWEGKIQRTV